MNRQPTYHEMSEELERILAELQQDDIDVDEATTKYERGLELIKQLGAYLKTAENKVTKLNSRNLDD